MPLSSEDQVRLLPLGDQLADELAVHLTGTAGHAERLQFMGRTLALNVVQLFVQTVEEVSRRVGAPLIGVLTGEENDELALVLVTQDGEVQRRVDVDALLRGALFRGRGLHPAVAVPLEAALHAGNENLCTRKLVACLRTRPVLDLPLPYLARRAT